MISKADAVLREAGDDPFASFLLHYISCNKALLYVTISVVTDTEKRRKYYGSSSTYKRQF